MKKTAFAILMVFTAFFIGCGNSPKSITESFLKESSKGDFVKAGEYCTDQTKGIMALAQTMMSSEKKAELQKNDFKVIKCTENGNNAECTYVVIENGKQGEEQKISLVKENDKWKVDINKNM